MPTTFEEYLEVLAHEQQQEAISFSKLLECQQVFTKTLSAYNENLGGALAPPPLQKPALPARRNQPAWVSTATIRKLRLKWRKAGTLATVAAAGKYLAKTWELLEERYGRREALLLAVTMLESSPLPGSLEEIIQAAEKARGVQTYFRTHLEDWSSKGWITIGGGPCEDGQGQHCGGTRIQIDEAGEVRKGPKRLRGRQLQRGPRPTSPRIKPEARSVQEPNPIPSNPEAKATTEPKKPLKSSRAQIKYEQSDARAIAWRAVEFGIKEKSDFANLVGAPDDAEVIVLIDDDDPKGIVIDVRHPSYTATRLIRKDASGHKYIKNDTFFMRGRTGTGLGTQVFSDQVAWAKEKGFDYIKTDAARSGYMNGYYTWMRLGYDAPLRNVKLDYSTRDEIEKKWPQAQTVQDIMATPEGKAWWKQNGNWVDGAKFYLQEGSRSLEILEDYLQERQEREKRQARTGASPGAM